MLRLALLGSVIVAAVLVSPVAAASETPIPNEQRPTEFVTRSFEPSGPRFLGTMAFSFVALQYRDAEAADANIEVVTDTILDGTSMDASALHPTSSLPVGDRSFARTGVIEDLAVGSSLVDAQIAVLSWRIGDVNVVGIAASLGTDPLPDLSAVASKAEARGTTGPAIRRESEGRTDSGLWVALPELADLPSGFVLDTEEGPILP